MRNLNLFNHFKGKFKLRIHERYNVLKNEILKLVKILIFLLLLQNVARADCMACYETQFIQLEYNNGKIEKGFILWNQAWIINSKGNYKGLTTFCDTIAEFLNNNNLKIYKKIRTFEHILPKVPISINGSISVIMERVNNLTRLENKLNHLQGAITIPKITDEDVKLLIKKPIFMYKTFGEGQSDAYYINYNPKYSEEYIGNIIESESTEKLVKVVKIEVHYD